MTGSESDTLLVLAADAASLAARLEGRLPANLELIACSDIEDAKRQGTRATLALGNPSLLAEVLDDLPRLRWAQSIWAGVRPLVDHPRRDYILTGVRGIFGQAMAEWTLGWLLALERGILYRSRATRWVRTCVFPEPALAATQADCTGSAAVACAATAR